MAASMRVSVTGLCVLLMCGLAAAQGKWITGIAVHTNGPEGNDISQGFPESLPDASCGYGTITEKQFPGFMLVGISNKSDLAKKPMGGCGTCLEVKCTDKDYCAYSADNTQTVMIYDTCEDCAANQLNLNAKVFNELAPLDLGRMAIEYREVPCEFTGNIIVNVDSFRTTSGGWIRLSLRNVAGAGDIQSVQLARANSTAFIPMKNTYGARWELSKLPQPFAPYDLCIITKSGQATVIPNAITKAGVTGDIYTTRQVKA